MWFFPGPMAFVFHGTALLTKRGFLPIVVPFALGIGGVEAAAQPADALSGGGQTRSGGYAVRRLIVSGLVPVGKR